MKILMVLTSHDQLGNTGRTTGFWLEEFAAPYFVFRDAGVQLTLASPNGGQPPIDPKSDLPENQTDAMARFKKDAAAQKALSQTAKLADMKSQDFDSIFYVGGHGPMWDLAESADSIALLESFYNSGKPIALVCHSPGVLRHVTYKGAPLVKGKQVTGFTNGEEEEMKLTHVVPFLVEDELMRLRGDLREGRRLAAVPRRRWTSDHRPKPGIFDGYGASSHQSAFRAEGCLAEHRDLSTELPRGHGPVLNTKVSPIPMCNRLRGRYLMRSVGTRFIQPIGEYCDCHTFKAEPPNVCCTHRGDCRCDRPKVQGRPERGPTRELAVPVRCHVHRG
jgi:putative intracellular protease/amidase